MVFGLIGWPLGHSYSAKYLNKKFSIEEKEDVYQLFPIERIESLPKLIRALPALAGLNVTIPWKEKVLPYLDEIDESAALVGAVNVIKIIRKENRILLKGYNTDFLAFKKTLENNFNLSSLRKGIILGTGGAAKATAQALRMLGIDYVKVSRIKSASDTIRYDNLNGEIIKSSDIIINATPLGMYPEVNNCPPIPYEFIKGDHICYDLIYNPAITEFLIKSASQGATIKNGLEMLYSQADMSLEIWRNNCE